MTEPTYQELATRLRELEDVREINEVFFKWHYDCTGGFNGIQAGRMEALDCLTEDATIEVKGMHEPGQGPRGREQYTKFWDYSYGDDGPLPYVFQTAVADKVEVDGDTAVQRSEQLGIFQPRGRAATIGLSQRTNTYVRTPDGRKIRKTTIDGGFSSSLPELNGNLNPLPEEMDQRTRWSLGG